MPFKYILYSIFFSVFLLLSSCKNSNSPQAVAESFLISYSEMDYETAKALSTRNTWDLLDILSYYTQNIPEEEKNAIATNFKIRITENNRESDSTVIITYTSDPKILPFNKLRLLKSVDRNGRDRWKVDISTLDLVGGEELYLERRESLNDEELIPLDTSQTADTLQPADPLEE